MPRETLASVQTPVAPDTASLKQPLQQVLASLSVDLETELMRYRQSRQGDGVPQVPRGLAFRKRRKPIDLIRVEAQPAPSTPAQQAAPALGQPLPPPLPPNPRLTQAVAGSSLAHREPDGPTDAPPPAAGEAALQPYQVIPEDFFETTEALLRSTPEPAADEWDTDYAPSLAQRLTTPLGIGALLLLLISSASLGYLLTNPKALAHIWQHPALQALRGQSQSETAAPGTPGANGSFEPGLDGMGPDLSQQEFVDLNLGRLSTLPGNANSAPNLASTPLTVTMPPISGQPGASAVPGSPAPTGSGTAVATALAPAAAPTPTYRPPVTVPTTVRPVQAPSRPAPVAAAPSRPAPSRPAPVQAAPARPATPAPAAPVQAAPPPLPASPSAPAPQAAAPNYYVVTDYTGDQSLDSARTAVGEAYVRNFPAGARIQMGAFEQESSAEALVQDLQQQGISAEVYRSE